MSDERFGFLAPLMADPEVEEMSGFEAAPARSNAPSTGSVSGQGTAHWKKW